MNYNISNNKKDDEDYHIFFIVTYLYTERRKLKFHLAQNGRPVSLRASRPNYYEIDYRVTLSCVVNKPMK